MTDFVEKAKDLSKRVEEKLGPSGSTAADKRPTVSNDTRRALFGELAALRNSAELAVLRNGAEAKSAGEAVEILDGQRVSMKVPRKGQTGFDKASMYFRLVLTIVTAMYGALCIILITPLRIVHPMLRNLGVRNGSLPVDVVVKEWARLAMAAAGIKVEVVGPEPDWMRSADTVGIIVYNHSSNLDPFILNSSCDSSPKYIGKKVLFHIPIIGWLFTLLGMVPINRGNREKAVAVMNEAVANVMSRWRRNVAISPEGTRTTDGHLRLPFKKGIFHLQAKTQVPLLPVAIQGAFELWPPGRVFATPGKVSVYCLPAVKPEEADQDCNSRDATRLKLQRDYSEFAAKHATDGASELSWMDVAGFACRLTIAYAVYWMVWRGLCSVAGFLGLTWGSGTVLYFCMTVAVALYVEKVL